MIFNASTGQYPPLLISSSSVWIHLLMVDECPPLRMNLYLSCQSLLMLRLHQSKMDRVFMIILLLNHRPNFENIQKEILTGVVIPNFDEALARLLRHTSTATQSKRYEITPNTSMMVSQSHSRSDTRGGHDSTRSRGQHPQCTYCHRLGHIRD